MNLLFVCTANSIRSQMAEGWALQMFGDRANILSAGVFPSGFIHGSAFSVMQEAGVNLGRQWSKGIDELPSEFMIRLDLAIILCDREMAPRFHSRVKTLFWTLPDPSSVAHPEQRMEAFRAVRDEIKRKLSILGQKLYPDLDLSEFN